MPKKARIDKRQSKKDTGIAVVDAKMSTGETVSFKMEEALRDVLNKRAGRRPTPPFDPNKATSQELENIQFSGFRLNRLSNELELWCLGKVAARRNAQQATANPGIIAQMHEEAFQTVGTIVTVPIEEPMEPTTPPFTRKDIN